MFYKIVRPNPDSIEYHHDYDTAHAMGSRADQEEGDCECVGGGQGGLTCGKTLYTILTLSRAEWTTGKHAEPGACDRQGAVAARTVLLAIVYDVTVTANFGGMMLENAAPPPQHGSAPDSGKSRHGRVAHFGHAMRPL